MANQFSVFKNCISDTSAKQSAIQGSEDAFICGLFYPLLQMKGKTRLGQINLTA